jgi:hypothetical protein
VAHAHAHAVALLHAWPECVLCVAQVRGEERYLAVERFKTEAETFVFLLSTRAGGIGLNLTQADTVIFVDSE